MQHKRKKITRKRGTETHGHGASKKNRGAGHRGGRGKSGAGKRGDFKIAKILKGKTRKEYLGKHGFTSKSDKKVITITLRTIENRLESYLAENKVKKGKDAYIVDIKDLGCNKLLANGNVINKFQITCEYASAGAIKKVEEAGGKVNLPNGDQTE